MLNQNFSPPVRVMVGGPGEIRVVGSVREAADCLLHYWPSDGGKKHHAARKACMDVLSGQRRAANARKAFEEAAKEADILIGADRH